jgi:hypothetical protein
MQFASYLMNVAGVRIILGLGRGLERLDTDSKTSYMLCVEIFKAMKGT